MKFPILAATTVALALVGGIVKAAVINVTTSTASSQSAIGISTDATTGTTMDGTR